MLSSGDAQVTLLLVPHKIAKLLPRNSSLARRWWRLPSERTRNRMFDLKGKDDTGRLRRRVSGTHNPPTDRKMRPVLLAFRPSAFSLSLSLSPSAGTSHDSHQIFFHTNGRRRRVKKPNCVAYDVTLRYGRCQLPLPPLLCFLSSRRKRRQSVRTSLRPFESSAILAGN